MQLKNKKTKPRRWVPPLVPRFWRNTANITEDLIRYLYLVPLLIPHASDGRSISKVCVWGAAQN